MKHEQQKRKRVTVETLMQVAFIRGFIIGTVLGAVVGGIGAGVSFLVALG